MFRVERVKNGHIDTSIVLNPNDTAHGIPPHAIRRHLVIVVVQQVIERVVATLLHDPVELVRVDLTIACTWR